MGLGKKVQAIAACALLRELRGIEYAWHTGSVPQPRRRAEILRFREDPECRLFLSSESGGVGLNLQVADTVVNMDQPWNPARLEQRIARAWRKHQTRPVNVINLVSEYTIEHRMLGLLDAKRALAEGVLDQRGDLSEIRLPTGRAAFMERLNEVLDRVPLFAGIIVRFVGTVGLLSFVHDTSPEPPARYIAFTIPSTIFFASENSIMVLSRKNSSFSIPA